jgi:hypothetical protein
MRSANLAAGECRRCSTVLCVVPGSYLGGKTLSQPLPCSSIAASLHALQSVSWHGQCETWCSLQHAFSLLQREHMRRSRVLTFRRKADASHLGSPQSLIISETGCLQARPPLLKTGFAGHCEHASLLDSQARKRDDGSLEELPKLLMAASAQRKVEFASSLRVAAQHCLHWAVAVEG